MQLTYTKMDDYKIKTLEKKLNILIKDRDRLAYDYVMHPDDYYAFSKIQPELEIIKKKITDLQTTIKQIIKSKLNQVKKAQFSNG